MRRSVCAEARAEPRAIGDPSAALRPSAPRRRHAGSRAGSSRLSSVMAAAKRARGEAEPGRAEPRRRSGSDGRLQQRARRCQVIADSAARGRGQHGAICAASRNAPPMTGGAQLRVAPARGAVAAQEQPDGDGDARPRCRSATAPAASDRRRARPGRRARPPRWRPAAPAGHRAERAGGDRGQPRGQHQPHRQRRGEQQIACCRAPAACARCPAAPARSSTRARRTPSTAPADVPAAPLSCFSRHEPGRDRPGHEVHDDRAAGAAPPRSPVATAGRTSPGTGAS